jgi:Tfp pilus assembly pilus retraction ATPase PilT
LVTTPTQIHSIDELLKIAVERDASDLHISAGSPPVIRVNGHLERLPDQPHMEPDDIRVLIYRILSTEQQKQLETKRQFDFSYSIPGLARFRVNAYFQRAASALRSGRSRRASRRSRSLACPSASTSSASSRAASCS